jgi:hypothetical protein
MRKLSTKQMIMMGAAAAVAFAAAGPAGAFHRWSTYHWARSSGELTIPVGDNVTSQWDSYYSKAVDDWNKSTVINSPKVPGSAGDPKQCRAVAGTIQVCNAAYGQRGWLGIASIWLSNGHISQGTTKLNDTYYAMARYNTPAWRAAVTCQEIGHDYGLGHQDEDFNTDATNSCMEYTSNPVGNESPDAHDYEELLTIYNHTESAAGLPTGGRGNSGNVAGDTPSDWGQAVHFDRQGRPDYFVQDLGGGNRKVTHVLWAIGEGPRSHHHD